MENEKLTPIGKALCIMELMSNDPRELNASEISNLTGLNRTTVYRILQELQEKEWVILNKKTKKFIVGTMAFHVGMAYTNNNNNECKILEMLDEVSQKLKESVGYAVREGDRVISLYESEIYQPYKLDYHAGRFYPMNKGCYGKCLMAYHDQERVKKLLTDQTFEKTTPTTLTGPDEILREYQKIREQGFAVSDEEVARYLMGVGVPVFNSEGEVKACVAAAFIKETNEQENNDKINEFIATLKKGVNDIKKYLT
jgi:DNA-binding IclR family transcriptional regulator